MICNYLCHNVPKDHLKCVCCRNHSSLVLEPKSCENISFCSWVGVQLDSTHYILIKSRNALAEVIATQPVDMPAISIF